MDVWKAWHRLGNVRKLQFEARPRSATDSGWIGIGEGSVEVEQADSFSLIFQERGTWIPEGGRQMTFRNVFRWTAAPEGDRIRLEHLRFGAENPVILFDLVPIAEEILESVEPHACREDRYSARLTLDQEAIRLNWTITGPRKDEKLAYSYR